MKRGAYVSAYYRPDEFGALAAECWCGAEIVYVPAAEIRIGQTRSCGRPHCQESP